MQQIRHRLRCLSAVTLAGHVVLGKHLDAYPTEIRDGYLMSHLQMTR